MRIGTYESERLAARHRRIEANNPLVTTADSTVACVEALAQLPALAALVLILINM